MITKDLDSSVYLLLLVVDSKIIAVERSKVDFLILIFCSILTYCVMLLLIIVKLYVNNFEILIIIYGDDSIPLNLRIF